MSILVQIEKEFMVVPDSHFGEKNENNNISWNI